MNWIPSKTSKPLPDNAVLAGNDNDGSSIFIGRSTHKGDQLVAKVIPSKKKAYVCHKGKEHSVKEYDVLVGYGFQWVSSQNGAVPGNAVPGGRTKDGETLYIGRAAHSASTTPGKIHPSHGCLYIPFGGKEIQIHSYEVLVTSSSAQWVRTNVHSIPPNAVRGGHDMDGSIIFVGRIQHGGDLIPAKVVPNKGGAFCSYGGREIASQEFEVLCGGNTTWVVSAMGQVPPNAVRGGHTINGETLFVGRGHWQGSLTVGKIQLSHQALYIPFGGVEVPIKVNHEVLIEF